MDLKKVARLVDEGKSITAIAKALKITRTTLYNRAKKDPKLAEIINSVDRKRGPPPIQINYEDVRKLAELGCTEYEIARFVGVTKDTFSLRKGKDPKIQEAIDIGSNDIKIALRRAQLKVAMPEGEYHGNVTMLIWLGKQYLKQTDHQIIDNDTDTESDGFEEALKAKAKDVWKEARPVQMATTEPEAMANDDLVET